MDRDQHSARADTVTPNELVARARALVPALRARQEETEATRRIPREGIVRLTRADL